MPPHNILLATDLEARTDRAMDRAVLLASGWDSQLVVAHAIESTWNRPRTGDPVADATRWIREELRDVPANVVVAPGEAAPLILSTITEAESELAVIGAGRGGLSVWGATSSGGTVDALVRRSPVPVLVVKNRATQPYQDLIVATDFSESSRNALVTALEMFPDARVTLFHAYTVIYEGYMDDKQAARAGEARHAEARAREFLEATPIANREIEIRCEYGQPDKALRALPAGDLIVVGTRNRGPVAEFFLGSSAKAILAESTCDVLIVGERVNQPDARR